MIRKILNKHEGYTNGWYPDVEDANVYVNSDVSKKYSEGCHEKEMALQDKWKDYIPAGWYGFSLGSPCPHAWYGIIDEFLEYLAQLQKDGGITGFDIHQIKIKFGGLRFYVSYSCEDEELREFIDLQISRLEDHLRDSKLVY